MLATPFDRTAEGFLREPEHWCWQFTELIAEERNIQLDEEKKNLILLVRKFHEQFGHGPSMRPLIRFARQELGIAYDSIRLTLLFPDRPAYLLALLAGIPKPPHCL